MLRFRHVQLSSFHFPISENTKINVEAKLRRGCKAPAPSEASPAGARTTSHSARQPATWLSQSGAGREERRKLTRNKAPSSFPLLGVRVEESMCHFFASKTFPL